MSRIVSPTFVVDERLHRAWLGSSIRSIHLKRIRSIDLKQIVREREHSRILWAYIVMAFKVMAYVVMANLDMTYIVMA